MLYELRIYEPYPGKMPALHARFRDHTIAIFQKHGIGVEWFATAMTGDWSDRLYYLLSFADLADRERKWAAFGADQDWQKARAASEQDGPLVKRLRSTFLNSTPYSPGG
ncbi:MAG TPA: NIPSNAP family protein [Dehalococcoidia bacterium]|nr:NIPSNAP family protein [Dehalococcoidia bacterium]